MSRKVPMESSLSSATYVTYHSVAKDNFNKSKETTPTTSAALKEAP